MKVIKYLLFTFNLLFAVSAMSERIQLSLALRYYRLIVAYRFV